MKWELVPLASSFSDFEATTSLSWHRSRLYRNINEVNANINDKKYRKKKMKSY